MVKLLFISYINRSGSTFLANEFSKYKSILVCPEAEVLLNYFIQSKEEFYQQPAKLHKLLSEILTTDPKLKFWNLDPSEFSKLDKYQDNFGIFFDILEKYRVKTNPEATIVLFKADILAYYYNNIPYEYYKRYNIRIISIIRDGRASYASQRETIGARKQRPMNRNPVKAAKLWKKWITFLAEMENDPRFVFIRYEDLIRNFQIQFNDLLSDLDITHEIGEKSDNGDLFYRIPLNQRHMHKNVIKPPLQENIIKWKKLLSPSHISIFEKIARKALIQNDYELMSADTNKMQTCLLNIYYLLIYYYQSSILKRIIHRSIKFCVFRIKEFLPRNQKQS